VRLKIVRRGRAYQRERARTKPVPPILGAFRFHPWFLVRAMRIRGVFVSSFDSEFSFYFGDAGAEAAFDLGDCLCLSEVAGLIEVPQVTPQLVEEFVGKAVAHRETILPQNWCRGGKFSLRQSSVPGRVLARASRWMISLRFFIAASRGGRLEAGCSWQIQLECHQNSLRRGL
jgi:hypothetical protein